MAQQEKSEIYRRLRDAGYQFGKQYRDYRLDDLRKIEEAFNAPKIERPDSGPEAPSPVSDPEAAGFFGYEQTEAALAEGAAAVQAVGPPVAEKNPLEMAGERLNTKAEDEVIRIDPDTGRHILQEEVLKPAYAKPRGRRVLRYLDRGTKTQTIRDNDGVTETFEVEGDSQPREMQAKITLPSYQVGISKDPRFPMFKIITYQGNEGFDLFDVWKFYGGEHLVDPGCKRKYVANVLCYDIQSVVATITAEYRRLQLAGRTVG
jgi:hypothetical protein